MRPFSFSFLFSRQFSLSSRVCARRRPPSLRTEPFVWEPGSSARKTSPPASESSGVDAVASTAEWTDVPPKPQWPQAAPAQAGGSVVEKSEARTRAMKSIGQVFSADDVVTAAGGVDSTAEDWYIGKSFNRPATRDDVIPLDTSEEESMPQWMAAQRRAEARRAGAELELADNGTADAAGVLTTSSILSVIKTERGGNVIVLDVAGKCDWTETMIIVDGGSTKQLYSIIDSVRRMAKKFIATDPSLPRSLTIEGVDSDDWMVLDLGRFVIHALTPEARAHYDIEGLWTSIRPESASVERRLMSDEEYEKEMLASVERAWEARPTTLVKTKQTEAEDLSDEQDVIKRINNAEVVRPQ